MDLAQARKECGCWDEELEWCDDEFPEECPYRDECKTEADDDAEE